MVENGKTLYAWNFINIEKLDVPLQLSNFRGRSQWVSLDSLQPFTSTLPGCDLRETCNFFIDRLSRADQKKLEDRAHALDGHEIVIGSTCSGTDICVGIMNATMQAINQRFKVPRPNSNSNCMFQRVLTLYSYGNERTMVFNSVMLLGLISRIYSRQQRNTLLSMLLAMAVTMTRYISPYIKIYTDVF